MPRDEVSAEDIRNAARRLAEYIVGLDRAAFVSDRKTQAAVVRELEIMGEAANRVSEGFRAAHPEVPWDRLVRLRHFYIHVYDAVDYGVVWTTATRTAPKVEAALSALLGKDATKTDDEGEAD